jgi:hypothetical protein
VDLNVLPKIINELRDDDAVADIVGANPDSHPARVRGFEPAPGDEAKPYRAFVVLTSQNTPPHPRLPVQRPIITGRAYGRTLEEAWALYMACSTALHGIGPRVHPNGLGIYASHDDVGGSQDKDPITGQPVVHFVVSLVATTQAVA